MRLNVVNPNTTAAMTRTIAAAATKAARPDTVIRAVSSAFGPASIEGAYDDAFAVPGLLEQIKAGEAEGADAHVIACFDDTGLDGARALAADVAVLELDNPASNARAKIGAEIARALAEDHAEAIVLGCAGMAD